ncbi:MAG: SLBB domain-containing protein, partial [Cytophagales bacterium]|nr:SLBB domain-containing protein [Cytophagales bacterium]
LLIAEKEVKEEIEVDTTIFGASIFNSPTLTFEPGINIPTPQNYQIGVGDELLIDIWGASQQTYQLSVEPSGNINIDGIGPVHLNGLTMQEANKRIIQKLSKIYAGLKPHGNQEPNTFAQVALANIRTIQVSVVGEAYRPGTYSLPSLATAFNALYFAGGPNKKGSYRNIQVIRDNKLYKTVDVYDFLASGRAQSNVMLRDQDIIIIPPFQSQIELSGEVQFNGYMQPKEGEPLSELIRISGGFTSNAYKTRLSVTRKNSKELELIDVKEEDFDTFSFRNGDKLLVSRILNRYKNRIQLAGALFRTGEFELTEGLTLREAIEKLGEGATEDAYMKRAALMRIDKFNEKEHIGFDLKEVLEGKKNILLRREDVIRIFSINELKESETVQISGQVQFEGQVPYAKGMSIQDLIELSGGIKFGGTGMKVEVSRRLVQDKEYNDGNYSEIFQFNINKDLSLDKEDKDFKLHPYDHVFVRRAPNFSEERVISVEGEVQFTGNYSLKFEGERISDILLRAGGLTQFAYIKGASLKRKRKITDLEKQKNELLAQNDTTLNLDILNQEFEYVGIDMEKILNRPKSNQDLVLRNGDIINVPTELQTVSINGEILNPVAVTYKPNKKLNYYINSSGGYSSKAKKNKTYIVYANGTARRTKHFLFFNSYPKVEPGAKIIVPKKPKREAKPQLWISLGSSLASLSLVIITIVQKL